MVKYVLFVHGKTPPSLEQIFGAVKQALPKDQYVLDRFDQDFGAREEKCESRCFMHTPVSKIVSALRRQIAKSLSTLPAGIEVVLLGKSAGGIPLAMLQRQFGLAHRVVYLGSGIVASGTSTVDTYAEGTMRVDWIGRMIRAHNGEPISVPTFSRDELSRTPTLFLHGELDDDAHNGKTNPAYEGNTGYSFLRQNSLALARQAIPNWTVKEIPQADHSFRLTTGQAPKPLSQNFLEEFIGWLEAKA